MNLSEEQVAEILESAKVNVSKALQGEFEKKITASVQHSFTIEVEKHASKWIAENIIPEIEAQLVESKEGLVSLGARVAEDITKELAQAITDDVKEKLTGDSWRRSKLLKAIFD